MAIPKDAVWVQQKTTLGSSQWPQPVLAALDRITQSIKAFNASKSPTTRRSASQGLVAEITAFEKVWKTAYGFAPMSALIVSLKVDATVEASVVIPVSAHKYDYVGCVAYEVGTGKFDTGIFRANWNAAKSMWTRTGIVEYTGAAYAGTSAEELLAGDKADYTLRCKWMKDEIDHAYTFYKSEYGTLPEDAKVLKVFMAPEFFFRGSVGAYDISAVSEIFVNLRTHTGDVKFKDWLFVFGTVIASTLDYQFVCPKCQKAEDNAHFKRIGVNRFICTDCNLLTKEELLGARIDNVALVQKGGETGLDNSYIVTKEYVSHIDFRREVKAEYYPAGKALSGLDNAAALPNWNAGRNIEVRGKTVPALPPDGSRDAEVGKLHPKFKFQTRPPGTGSEEKSGGAIFTVDGIKIGLEICLDHLNARLPGGSGLHVQLVPSAGASLKQFACVTDGIAFNVDGGGTGRSDVRVNDSGAAPSASTEVDGYVEAATSGGGGKVVIYDPQPIPWS